MRRKLLVLVLPMTLCVFGACAPPKPNADAEPRLGVESAKPEAFVPSSVTADKPSRSAVPVAAPSAAPVAPSQPKPHDVPATQPSAKNNFTEAKPAEMKVANALEQNPQLSSILKPLLPSRSSVVAAAAGFKNQRQFIAAMHLSKNLGLQFDQIKTRMIGEHHMSLNDSLRDLKPDMTKNVAKAEVKKAEEQAKDDEKQAKDEAKKAAAQEKVAANGKS